MREALDMQQTTSWREFQAVASVLVAAGALEPDTYRVSWALGPAICLNPHTCTCMSLHQGFCWAKEQDFKLCRR